MCCNGRICIQVEVRRASSYGLVGYVFSTALGGKVAVGEIAGVFDIYNLTVLNTRMNENLMYNVCHILVMYCRAIGCPSIYCYILYFFFTRVGRPFIYNLHYFPMH